MCICIGPLTDRLALDGLTDRPTDGRTPDGCTGPRTDEWTDGPEDGWACGLTDPQTNWPMADR